MLREFQVTKDKPANSMYKSGEEKIVTGMAVVKNESNKTFEFASAETASDLCGRSRVQKQDGRSAGCRLRRPADGPRPGARYRFREQTSERGTGVQRVQALQLLHRPYVHSGDEMPPLRGESPGEP